MAKFPGGYEPDPAGLREIGSSAALGAVCLAQAQKAAEWANSVDPGGRYRAVSRILPGGWDEEPRQGAIIEEGEPGSGDARLRALARSVNVIEG